MRFLFLFLLLVGCSTNIEHSEESFPVCYSEINQILQDEGEVVDREGSHISYLDTKALMTGGHGHLFNRAERAIYPLGNKIPYDVVEFWFKEDYYNAQQDVLNFLDGVVIPVQVENVLINMSFNLGRSNLLEFTKMREAIFRGDWEGMANEMEQSVWFNDVGSRATRLIERIRMFNIKGSSFCNESRGYSE